MKRRIVLRTLPALLAISLALTLVMAGTAFAGYGQQSDSQSRQYYGQSDRQQYGQPEQQQQYGRQDQRDQRQQGQFDQRGQQQWDQQYDQRGQQKWDQQYDRRGQQQWNQQYGEQTGRQQYGQQRDSQSRQYYGRSDRQPYGQPEQQQQYGRQDQWDQRQQGQFDQRGRQQWGQQYDQRGQQQWDRQYDQRGQQQWDQRHGQRGRQQLDQQTQGQGPWLEPKGWVRIGYDFNNDNIVDAYEWISYYELQQAQERSRMGAGRERGHEMGMQRDRFEQAPSRQMMEDRGRFQQARRPMDQIQGTVKEMKTISLSQIDENHVFARIRTEDGRVARVDLGPEKKIKKLNLQQGDNITVYGTSGNINDRPVLMAEGVETKGRRISVQRPRDLNLKRYQGKILKTKQATFGQQDASPVLMARVRLDNGNSTIVNLGPEQEIRNQLNIQEGQNFDMLARAVNIGGRKALVAEHLRVGNKDLDVDWQQARRSEQTQ